MDFLTALRAAQGHAADSVRVSRPDGPSFIVDNLGQVTVENDCAYLGDFLDFEDWQVEAVPVLVEPWESQPMPDGADELRRFWPTPRA